MIAAVLALSTTGPCADEPQINSNSPTLPVAVKTDSQLKPDSLQGGRLKAATNTWYVSSNGSDLAEGSSTAPLRTLAEAAERAQAGDTVLIGEGTYRETLIPRKSGSFGAPITFSAAPGAAPLITGCDLIGDWKNQGNGRWEGAMDWNLGPGRNEIFWNGKPLTEACFPKATSNDPTKKNLAPITFESPNKAHGKAFQTDRKDRWAGAFFYGYGYEAWAFQSAKVASSDGDSLVFDPATKSNPWFHKPRKGGDPVRLKKGDGAGMLFGLPEFLEAQGEWFMAHGTLRLIPPDGSDPTKAIVEARRRPWTVDLNGKSHIIVRGLRLRSGSVRIGGDNNLLEECEGMYLSHFILFQDGYSQDDGTPEGTAVRVDGTGNVVNKCRFQYAAGCGICLGGKANTVSRCLVEDIDWAGTYGAGITLVGCSNSVLFNTIRRTGRDCIHIPSIAHEKNPNGGGHRILFNDVSLPGQVCRDTGIFYTYGSDGNSPDGHSTRIAYNWFHDNAVPAPAVGIYLDNYVRNYLVDHNVVWKAPHDAGIRINGPAVGSRVFNNTLFNTLDVGVRGYNLFPQFNPDPSFWTSKEMYSYENKNNLFLGNEPESQLVGPEVRDFSLKPGVAAIAAGESIPLITHAPAGRNPDLGAYQSGLPPWKPGHEGHADDALLRSLGLSPNQ